MYGRSYIVAAGDLLDEPVVREGCRLKLAMLFGCKGGKLAAPAPRIPSCSGSNLLPKAYMVVLTAAAAAVALVVSLVAAAAVAMVVAVTVAVVVVWRYV